MCGKPSGGMGDIDEPARSIDAIVNHSGPIREVCGALRVQEREGRFCGMRIEEDGGRRMCQARSANWRFF